MNINNFSKRELELHHLIQLIPSRSIALIDWEAVMSYNNLKLSYLMLWLPQINEKVFKINEIIYLL